MIKFISNTNTDEFSNINENDLYVCEEENRILIGKLGKLKDIIKLPLLEVVDGSTTNATLTLPVEYNNVKGIGLIVQWGRTSVTSGENIIKFNNAFSTTNYIIMLTTSRETENVGAVKIDTGTFAIKSNATTNVFWFAIGR